ncbi:hypothetical protein, partial [Arcobacter sp. CECT 9188]|uniref:hypothetical protein n=1 Tax=Arcobacter sp. CECT 9188 TaxID=2044505 RepID=UPI002159F36C
LCLASMIFRCDIDNINYQCPKLNGCIRHFIQILAVFAYKFNIDKWKIEKLNTSINKNNYVHVISNCGYPGNAYNVS